MRCGSPSLGESDIPASGRAFLALCERLKAAPDRGMPLTIEEDAEARKLITDTVIDHLLASRLIATVRESRR